MLEEAVRRGDPAVTRERIKDAIAVILGGGEGRRLYPLTRDRSKPAVPIAGKYRLIDIPISNCLHSGIDRMFVLTQFNSLSLHRHIALTYRFDPFTRGYVQILAAQQTRASQSWFQGTADAVRQNLGIFLEARGDLVLVLSGDHMYRMDYRAMLRDHLERGADITLAVLPCTGGEIGEFGAVRVDDSLRVVEFREKPKDAGARRGLGMPPAVIDAHGLARERPYLASMGIYLFRKPVLRLCLDNELHDFGHHVIPAAVERFRVQGHLFRGYWRDIGTIRAFYEAQMDLVRADPPFDFYDPEWLFYTHPRYLPGSSLSGVVCHRSIMADGAVIRDSTIEDSIVGMRTMMRNAEVRRSLIMGNDPYPPPGPAGAPPIGIGDGSLIQDAILDKNARIGRNVRIVNARAVQSAEGPDWVIRDGIVVIAKDAVIPDGTSI
jgi:glucose-1-phosphate adenylyltransferase